MERRRIDVVLVVWIVALLAEGGWQAAGAQQPAPAQRQAAPVDRQSLVVRRPSVWTPRQPLETERHAIMLRGHAALLTADVAGAESLAVLAPADRMERAGGEGDTDPRLWSLALTKVPIITGIALVASGAGKFDESRTILNSALIWGGALAGPAAGYFKSGRAARGLEGIAWRSAIFAAAWALAPTRDFNDGFVPNPSTGDEGVWMIAIPMILALDVVDIVRAKPKAPDAR